MRSSEELWHAERSERRGSRARPLATTTTASLQAAARLDIHHTDQGVKQQLRPKTRSRSRSSGMMAATAAATAAAAAAAARTAEVDVGAVVQQVEHLVGVLLNLKRRRGEECMAG